MSNASPLPVFSGKKSLSLAELDSLANAVRDAQLKIASVGGAPPRGQVHVGNAWYIPSPVGGLGGTPYFSAISPGRIAGVEYSRAYDVPLILDGMLTLPMAHMELHEEIDPEDNYTDFYPGAVDAVEVVAGHAARLNKGCIELPLARSPEVEAASGVEYETTAGIPGLLHRISWASGITRPYVADGHAVLPLAAGETAGSSVAGGIAGVQWAADPSITTPRILPGGIIELPRSSGGELPLAEFGGASGITVPGAVQGMLFNTRIEAPVAAGGIVELPLADSGGSGSAVRMGGMCGVRYTTAVSEPRIAEGWLELPPASGALQGVLDITGSPVTWQQLEGLAGSRVTAAGFTLQVGENNYIPLYLDVGYSGGMLSFALH